METKTIIITRDDIDYSLDYCKDFLNSSNCALAKATKRALQRDDINVGVLSVWQESSHEDIGYLSLPFGYDDYVELRNGLISQFKTELIPV